MYTSIHTYRSEISMVHEFPGTIVLNALMIAIPAEADDTDSNYKLHHH